MPNRVITQRNGARGGHYSVAGVGDVFIPTDLSGHNVLGTHFTALGNSLELLEDRLKRKRNDLSSAGIDKEISDEATAIAKVYRGTVVATTAHARSVEADLAKLDAVPEGDSALRVEYRALYSALPGSKAITRLMTVAGIDELDAVWERIELFNFVPDLIVQIRDRRRLLNMVRIRSIGVAQSWSLSKIIATGQNHEMVMHHAKSYLKALEKDAALIETAEITLQRFVQLIAGLRRETAGNTFTSLMA